MPDHKPKVIVVAEKVMPYRTALYREMAGSPRYDLQVLFLDAWGRDTRFDPTMNSTYAWDGPVLEGFDSRFLKPSYRCRTTYTGIDRTAFEQKVPILGTVIFYLRVYFGVLSGELLRTVARGDYDVLQLEGYSSINYIMALCIAKWRRKKVVLRSEAYLHRYRPRSVLAVKWVFLRTLTALFDAILYSGQSGREYYLHYGAAREKLHFVPSAVDNAFFLREQARLRKEGNPLLADFRASGQNERVPVRFIGVGRLVPRKNWMDAIRAFASFTPGEAELVIVGDGPERQSLEAFIQQQGLKNIRLAGFRNQTEISVFYDWADVLLLTADYDPSPKVVNESLIFGLPVILADSIGTASDLCDGNGFLYRYGDLDDLRSKIRLMIDDPGVRARFSARSVELSNIWSVAAGARNIESVVASLLPSSGQR